MSTSDFLHSLAGEGKVLDLVRGIKANNGLNVQRSTDGRTLLMTSAACGQHSCLQALLAMQADIHLFDHKGRTALSWAVEAADTDSVQTLLQAGAAAEVAGGGPNEELSLRERTIELNIPDILELIETAMRLQRSQNLAGAWPAAEQSERERL